VTADENFDGNAIRIYKTGKTDGRKCEDNIRICFKEMEWKCKCHAFGREWTLVAGYCEDGTVLPE
jgi:hypothetical protein